MKLNNNSIAQINKINQNNYQTKKSSEKLSSGKKVNSAADDAAGLAIAEKMEALIKGLGKGVNNTYDMKNALSVAGGGLSSVEDSLQRVRELSVQASNGTLTNSDRSIIQEEISANLDHISSTVSNTQFNGKNLLDGTFTNQNVAMGNSNTSISIDNISLQSLGLDGFNVTNGNIDISIIDDALSSISSASTKIGASINRFDHSISASETAILNQVNAKSKILDTDMAKQSSISQMNDALTQYGIFAQKNNMNAEANMLSKLL